MPVDCNKTLTSLIGPLPTKDMQDIFSPYYLAFAMDTEAKKWNLFTNFILFFGQISCTYTEQ